jgi:hypothetical protein
MNDFTVVFFHRRGKLDFNIRAALEYVEAGNTVMIYTDDKEGLAKLLLGPSVTVSIVKYGVEVKPWTPEDDELLWRSLPGGEDR